MRRSGSVLVLAAALASATAAPSAAAGPVEVEMRSLSYAPTKVTFSGPGRVVRWVNVTSPSRLHDAVSSLPDYFASPLLTSGETHRFRFRAAGTFTYICTIHDVMLGRVEVAPIVSVVDGGSGPALRITLGTQPFARDADYRWTIFLQGPGDSQPTYRRLARAATVDVPVDAPGDWSVVVRLRHRPSGTPSSESPTVTVNVPA